MSENATTTNPFAPPEVVEDSSLFRSAPISNYFYAAVLFVLGGFSAAFVILAAMIVLHAVVEIPVAVMVAIIVIGSLVFGWYSGLRMFRSLQDLHEQKVQLEREQMERLGEFHTW